MARKKQPSAATQTDTDTPAVEAASVPVETPAAAAPVVAPTPAAPPPAALPRRPQRFRVPFGGRYAVDGSIHSLAAGSVVCATTHDMAAILTAKVQLEPLND